MTIQEILEAHKPSRWRSFTNENEILRCCGKDFGNATKKAKRGDGHLAWTEFNAHVAEVLDKHMQEREAAVIAGLAELLDEYRSNHDIAECAAPVEGEAGRQSVIDKWETICEEPAEWLREQSKLHHENGFEYLRYVAYEAWYAGKESDSDEENPYADEELHHGR
ncbi:hypothetical protein [Glutamicibacter sp. MCAF14]|uniref:hypothetical protein n=1 Tax=Glutamicibacter sp. MCAF14 TaxID=3233043 RepID=UPI003F8DFE8E